MRRRRLRRLLVVLPLLALAIGGTPYLASNTLPATHAGSTTMSCHYSSTLKVAICGGQEDGTS